MIRMRLVLVLFLFGATTPAVAEALKLAVTTSFHNSGLADILLPEIAEDTGIDVHLLVVGTGQAIRLGEAGDVDAILVHSRDAEEAFVSAGFGTHRREIMYNDFVLIGPGDDPAGISNSNSINSAFKAIATAEAIFVSRGDDSGTHRRELALWISAGVDIDADWYRELGAGMGATLNTAVALGAYVLSDRATWLNFNNRNGMKIVFQGDPALLNQYAYIPVNPAVHAHVEFDLATKIEAWLASEKGQKMIADFSIDGQSLFTPNAASFGSTDN